MAQPHDPDTAALEESGRTQLIAGTALLTTGGIMTAAGIGLIIAGTVMSGTCASYDDHTHHTTYGSCGDGTLAFAGAVTLFLGMVAFAPGGALKDSGERDLMAARMSRRWGCHLPFMPVEPSR
jgi:hypothetical protein